MCGDNRKSDLGYECTCPMCGTQVQANSCIYYPYYCPTCDDDFGGANPCADDEEDTT